VYIVNNKMNQKIQEDYLRGNLNKILRQKNIVQRKFAEKIGISPGNLNSRLARGDNVQLELIKRISRGLQISLDELVFGTTIEPVDKEICMIHEMLALILKEGDKESVENIVGKITLEAERIKRLGKHEAINGP